MRIINIVCLVFVSASSFCQYQRDSVVYDTIQLNADTTIIKKKVIVKEVTEKPPLAIGYYTEANFSPLITNTWYTNHFIDSISTSLQGYSASVSQCIVVNNYLLQAGINYTNLHSSFHYEKYSMDINTGSYNVIDTINIHYYIINGDSVPEVVTEQRTVDYSDTARNHIHLKGRQRYQFLNIPVLFGYRFRAEKFAIHVKAGVVVQLLLSARGEIIDQSSLTLNKLQEVAPKKTSVVSIMSIGFEYPFSRYFSIYAEPVFHKGLSGFKQNPQIKNVNKFGVNLGLQYWF